MKSNTLELAKYIINKCTCEDNPISNLHLQKILYFIQRAFLKNDKIAFQDDIEAWQFGPVVPTVYYHYCGFGAMKINRKYDINLDGLDMKLADKIISEKSIKYPWDLVEETHEKGKTWDVIFKDGVGNKDTMPLDLIKKLG
jgi:uncharacterized phage-associated protein